MELLLKKRCENRLDLQDSKSEPASGFCESGNKPAGCMAGRILVA